MKIKHLIYILSILLVGCASDEPVSESANRVPITLSVQGVETVIEETREAFVLTAANYTDYKIYLSAWGSPKKTSGKVTWKQLFKDDPVFSYSGDTKVWASTVTEYWFEDNNYYFHAIMPYIEGLYSLDINEDTQNKAKANLTFTNVGDRTEVVDGIDEGVAYGNVDVLRAFYKSETSENKDVVDLDFSHALARVKLRFVGSKQTITNVKLETIAKATINIGSNQSKDNWTDREWSAITDDSGATTKDLYFGNADQSVAEAANGNTQNETAAKFIIPNVANSVYKAKFTIGESATETEVEFISATLKKGTNYVFIIDLTSYEKNKSTDTEDSSDEDSGSDSSDDSTDESQSEATRSAAPMKAKVKTRIIEEPM